MIDQRELVADYLLLQLIETILEHRDASKLIAVIDGLSPIDTSERLEVAQLLILISSSPLSLLHSSRHTRPSDKLQQERAVDAFRLFIGISERSYIRHGASPAKIWLDIAQRFMIFAGPRALKIVPETLLEKHKFRAQWEEMMLMADACQHPYIGLDGGHGMDGVREDVFEVLKRIERNGGYGLDGFRDEVFELMASIHSELPPPKLFNYGPDGFLDESILMSVGTIPPET